MKPLAILAILSLSATGCGAAAPSDAGPAEPSPTAVAPSVGDPAVPEVLDFEAPLLGGGTFRGETLAGRDVAFWFWAPW